MFTLTNNNNKNVWFVPNIKLLNNYIRFNDNNMYYL